jgi:PKD repeat protein
VEDFYMFSLTTSKIQKENLNRAKTNKILQATKMSALTETGELLVNIGVFLLTLARAKRQSHLSNATHVRSKASKLFALFFILLFASTFFSPPQPIKAEAEKESVKNHTLGKQLTFHDPSYSVAEATTLFFDDFESYEVGTFPSAGGWVLVWNGMGSKYQVVTSDHYHSPSKSFQLLGSYGWSSVAERHFSTAAKVIGFEAYVMAEEYTHHNVKGVGSIGFWNREEATWGKYYVTVAFMGDGYLAVTFINASGSTENIELQPYTPGTWYKVKVVLDRSTNTLSVWINDALKASNIKTTNTNINALEVSSAWAEVRCYFDDIKVFTEEGSNLPPTLSLSDPQISGLTVTINGAVSPGYSGASISRIHWEWGDGKSEDSSAFPASHTYSSPGTYTITVTVYQSDGLTAKKTVTVTVQAPSFDFSVSTSGTSFSVVQGDSIIIPVSVSLIEGTPSSVSLSGYIVTKGLVVMWFRIEFNPSSGTPPFSSTLTIKVPEDAPPGTYEVGIIANGVDANGVEVHHYTTVTVKVNPPLEIMDYSTLVEQKVVKPYNPLARQTIEQTSVGPYTPPEQLETGLTITSLSKGIPTEGQYFWLLVTIKNSGKSPIKVPSSLIPVSRDPDRDPTGEVPMISCLSTINGEIILDPSVSETIMYKCVATWHFIDPVSFTETAKQAFINVGISALASVNELVEIYSEANDIKDIIAAFTYNKVICPYVTYDLTSFPAQGKKISVKVIVPKNKFDAFNGYVHFTRPTSRVLSFGSGLIASIGINAIFSLTSEGVAVPPLLEGGTALAIAINALAVPVADYYYEKVMSDPSLNYTRLVPPPTVPGAFSRLPNSTEYKALLYEYLFLAYLNASAESMARANGAREMNDTKYYYLQLRNAQMYAANASIYYSRLVPLLVQIVEELNRSGYINEASFIKGKEYIAKNGLPSNVTRLLEELGFTKYINIREVEEQIKSAKYEPLNVTAFKEALELSKKYNPAALFNQSFAEELESVSNKTLCQVVLNATGPSNATVKVDGKDYPLPSSLYLNLGTRHNLTFAQVVPGLFQDYVFKELHVGNQTYANPSIQLTVLEPVSVTAIYEARPSTLAIAIIALALLAAIAAAYTLRRKHAAKPLPPPPPPS